MSLENRAQIQGLLNAVWGTLRDEVAESRGLASNTIDALADDLVITDAGEALAQGLIDGLIYEKGFENKIKAALEIDAAEEYKVISFNKINVRIKEYNKE